MMRLFLTLLLACASAFGASDGSIRMQSGSSTTNTRSSSVTITLMTNLNTAGLVVSNTATLNGLTTKSGQNAYTLVAPTGSGTTNLTVNFTNSVIYVETLGFATTWITFANIPSSSTIEMSCVLRLIGNGSRSIQILNDDLQFSTAISTNALLSGETEFRLTWTGTQKVLDQSPDPYLTGLTGNVQTQLGTKQATFTTGVGVTNVANVMSANIAAGNNITLTTGANGQVSIAASGGDWTTAFFTNDARIFIANGASALTAFGDAVNTTHGTSSASASAATHQQGNNFVSGATIGNTNGFLGQQILRYSDSLDQRVKILMVETNAVRYFFGSTVNAASVQLAVSNPAQGDFVGFRYDDTVGPNWYATCNDGGAAPTSTDTGVQANLTETKLEYRYTPTVGIVYYINNAAVVTNSTDIPRNTIYTGRVMLCGATLEAVAKNMIVMKSITMSH